MFHTHTLKTPTNIFHIQTLPSWNSLCICILLHLPLESLNLNVQVTTFSLKKLKNSICMFYIFCKKFGITHTCNYIFNKEVGIPYALYYIFHKKICNSLNSITWNRHQSFIAANWSYWIQLRCIIAAFYWWISAVYTAFKLCGNILSSCTTIVIVIWPF